MTLAGANGIWTNFSGLRSSTFLPAAAGLLTVVSCVLPSSCSCGPVIKSSCWVGSVKYSTGWLKPVVWSKVSVQFSSCSGLYQLNLGLHKLKPSRCLLRPFAFWYHPGYVFKSVFSARSQLNPCVWVLFFTCGTEGSMGFKFQVYNKPDHVS